MGESAVRLARNVDYVGAGTVEFVVDDRDNSYYFLEMNTRIQVEHPGHRDDQRARSGGRADSYRVRASRCPSHRTRCILDGHAIECRINAEDPDRGFFPSPGLVEEWGPPSGPGVRVDTHCYSGYTVSPYYDSLLAKIIVHAPTRAEAIQKMSTALSELTVTGPTTTATFHHSVLAHPDFAAGAVTTRWVEDTFLRQSLTEAGASA